MIAAAGNRGETTIRPLLAGYGRRPTRQVEHGKEILGHTNRAVAAFDTLFAQCANLDHFFGQIAPRLFATAAHLHDINAKGAVKPIVGVAAIFIFGATVTVGVIAAATRFLAQLALAITFA